MRQKVLRKPDIGGKEEVADGENPTTTETQVITQRLRLPHRYSRVAKHLLLVTQDEEE